MPAAVASAAAAGLPLSAFVMIFLGSSNFSMRPNELCTPFSERMISDGSPPNVTYAAIAAAAL